MTTSIDYSNRTVDVLMFQGADVGGDKPITLSLGDAGSVCTGLQKMSQTFTSIFLTRLGTIPSRPTFGTDFVTRLQQGAIRNERSVKSEFDTASELARRTMSTEAVDNSLPTDETLVSAVLNSFKLDFGASKLTLVIKLTSAAGTDAVIYLPVPLAIR